VQQPIEAIKVPLESPAVDRRSKPKLDDSFEEKQTFKYVPYMETTKPFEMADFYKYSTKYKKSTNGSESSAASSTSHENNNKPPELPAKNSPAKSAAPPPPPPKKSSNLNTNGDLGETFSSEMLQWYKNQSRPPGAATTTNKKNDNSENSTPTNSVGGGNDKNSDKPATLV
jgi:hypothetical protein